MPSPPDPSPLFQLATGYWPSMALLTAAKMRVFDAVGETGSDAPTVAQRLRTEPNATQRLLETCTALGLFTLESGRFRRTPIADAWLVSTKPGSLIGALDWSMDQVPAWAGLTEVVTTGCPTAPPKHLGADPDETRRFVLGMHSRAMGVAQGLAPLFPLGGRKRLLDIGGGPAAYAVLLARQHPELHITIVDLPAVAEIGRELVSKAGLAAQITVLDGDAASDQYGTEMYDAVLISGVLHQFSEATIRRVLSDAAKALTPDGVCIVADMMRDKHGTGPLFSTLFSLQMLVASEEGKVFCEHQLVQWMEDCGLQRLQSVPAPPPLPHTVVWGTKPATP